MAKKKVNSKVLAQQKSRRRQWITFVRMCRYGVNNFSRNAWLTIAATAIMTITLLVLFVSVVARNILVDTSGKISSNVEMSIYLKTDTDKKNVDTIRDELLKIEDVTNVVIKSPQQAREKIIQDNKDNPEYLEAIKEMNSQLPWTLSVSLVDINNTTSLAKYTEESELVTKYSSRPPSFSGERKVAIETIGRAVSFAQNVGLIVGALFVGISILIIFNTIRMAIFNRKEEIQMMKLIGAERSFIRGPFIVESVMYGFIASLITLGVGYGLLYAIEPALTANDIYAKPTIDLLTTYAGVVLLGLILVGAIIGIISSSMATRKYLKT